MKSQLQIYIFTKDNLIIVISKKYTLITLSTFLNFRKKNSIKAYNKGQREYMLWTDQGLFLHLTEFP
jgi:hypothetical protein